MQTSLDAYLAARNTKWRHQGRGMKAEHVKISSSVVCRKAREDKCDKPPLVSCPVTSHGKIHRISVVSNAR